MRIAIADFRPDLADLDNEVTATAINVIPSLNSYRPIKGPVAFTTVALEADPRGLWLAKTNAGDFQPFVAETTKLKKLNGTDWDTLASSLTGPGEEDWAGVQYGTDFYFNNVNDGLYKFDIEAGSTAGAVSSSPNAKHMDVVGEYLVCANTDTSPRQIAWSDTNDGDTWSGGNSGSQTFPDGGAITAVCGAANIIVQEEILRHIIPDPGGDIFAFEKVEQARGSIAPQSVIRFGADIAYLSEDGFYFAGQPIGKGAVNRYFLSLINQDQLFSVIGRVDPERGLFWWHFKTGGSATTYDRAMIYSPYFNKWSEALLPILYASQSATPGYTLETLSTAYPDLDNDVPYSLDSRVWLGGRPVYAVIDEDRYLAFLSGDNLEATIDTGEREIIQGSRTRVGGVRPIVDNANAVIRVRTRNRLGDAVTWGSEISQQTSGLCPVNRGGRYHRFRTRIPAAETWTHAQGIEIPDNSIARDGLR